MRFRVSNRIFSLIVSILLYLNFYISLSKQKKIYRGSEGGTGNFDQLSPKHLFINHTTTISSHNFRIVIMSQRLNI